MVTIINGVKHYPMSWDYAEHKIETERIRLENKIYVLKNGFGEDDDDEGLVIVTGGISEKNLKDFKALPKDEQKRKICYLERVLARMNEVRDLADRYVTTDARGRLTAWMDGKTYAAVRKICAGYEIVNAFYCKNH